MNDQRCEGISLKDCNKVVDGRLVEIEDEDKVYKKCDSFGTVEYRADCISNWNKHLGMPKFTKESNSLC